MSNAPTLEEIETAASSLSGKIVATPMLKLNSDRMIPVLPAGSNVHMKMELFQQAGSFKSRGVLLAIAEMSETNKRAGVTAVSAGNHALAVSWGAKNAGLSAKVVMPKSADPIRVEGCKALGAEVVLMDNVGDAFTEVDRLVREEGRTMLHPFESKYMTLGAATCGLEIARSVPKLDLAIIPIGGGGLISGIAPTIKLLHPNCRVIGVEPYGADSMSQSFAKGEAVKLDGVKTIADSLGAPLAMPVSYGLARQYVDEIILIEDDLMRQSMKWMFDGLKVIAEPACASTLAALCGPLREQAEGKNVAIIACGSNIGIEKFSAIVSGELVA